MKTTRKMPPRGVKVEKLLSADEVKAHFRSRGLSLTEWAREHGYPPNAVHRVTAGLTKSTRGLGHEIAVELGMKARPTEGVAA